MPTVTADGTPIRYETAGRGEETIVFLSEAGMGPWLWGWQAPALAGRYRTVVVATRGTDGSGAAGPYSVDRLAADLEAVLAAAGVRRAHLVGAGLGGAVALRYAREYGRARSLVSFGAVASGGDVDDDALHRLSAGTDGVRESLSVAFSGQFLESGPVDRIREWRRDEDASGTALAGHLAALESFEAGRLYELTLPALICHGIDDPVVAPAAGESLAETLPRGRFEAIEGRRLCFIEHARAVTDAIDGFLEEIVRNDG